jgi:hypothetical protein
VVKCGPERASRSFDDTAAREALAAFTDSAAPGLVALEVFLLSAEFLRDPRDYAGIGTDG